jgi:hypothetical protein
LFNNKEKAMKRLAMMAVTGVMVFALSACGEDVPQKPDVQGDDMMQPQAAQPAAPAAANAAQPTKEDMAGATAQE